MRMSSISVTFGGGNSYSPAADLSAANARIPSSVSWRKAILLNRSALLSVWPRHFPQHSFYDLHLISPIDRANSYWDGDDWTRAARAYHADRKRGRS
jgi:hypothetical protein